MGKVPLYRQHGLTLPPTCMNPRLYYHERPVLPRGCIPVGGEYRRGCIPGLYTPREREPSLPLSRSLARRARNLLSLASLYLASLSHSLSIPTGLHLAGVHT